MRTFTLVNGNMQTCSITEKELFFHEPTGLGFERSDTYRQVGDRWVRVNRKRKQKTITGSVALLGADPYLSYYNFVQFLQIEPLVLLYRPNNEASPDHPSGVTYRINVDATKLEKGEMERDGYLDCSITFTPTTPWYKYVAISNGTIDSADTLKWGIEWGIDWGPLDEYARGIKAEGAMPSPSRLTIYGPVVNPHWTHYVNGIKFEEGKLAKTITSDQYIVVDSTVDPYLIKLYNSIDNSEVEDLYKYSDFTTKRFITLQNGSNIVSVTDDNSADPTVKLEAFIYYESV